MSLVEVHSITSGSGREVKGKKGVHIQVSALVHSVASYNLDTYFPAITASLKMPSWDCKSFCSVEFLASKTRSSEPTNTFSGTHTYRFLTKRGLKISNYKIIRI